MIKLYKKIILFLAPILILILLAPVSKRLKYQGLEGACADHGIKVHDRIYKNAQPIDVVFLGSSQTINGINDALISRETNLGEVVNLGYCKYGRNLHYALLKELIKNKKVNHLILEVREEEDRYSHAVFPYIAESKDVLFAHLFFNRDILKDIWTHLVYKIELSQEELFLRKRVPLYSKNYGFAEANQTIAPEYLGELRLKDSIKHTKDSSTKLSRAFYNSYPKGYIHKIGELCKTENIQLSFLYIPGYGYILDAPKEHSTYKEYGEVIIAPKNIFEEKSNWSDQHHLNGKGANELSMWLVDYFNKKE